MRPRSRNRMRRNIIDVCDCLAQIVPRTLDVKLQFHTFHKEKIHVYYNRVLLI